jgi:glycosyltransferase involved in cell wall biosynthesis
VSILVFHGYLLRGTGSNVYNARLAAALRSMGQEVHLLSQEREPESLEGVDAVGDWDDGRLRVRVLREPVRLTVYRPDLGGLLPVYVADRYEGVEARTFSRCSDAEVSAYVERNVAAVREVARRTRPDVALANHLVMGPAILARALAGLGVPYAVKVHGSALEYTVAPDPERFLPWAREGLAPARAVLVGSRHVAERLWETVGDPGLPNRTRLGPPGVDLARFAPRAPEEAACAVRALGRRLIARDAPVAFGHDGAAAGQALARLEPGRDRLVAYVGKLLVAKGVDLLAAAWPLVLAAEPAARLVVVGFGGFRDGLERLLAALAAGDLATVRDLAHEGRAAEGGSARPLAHLLAFLDALEEAPAPRREAYLRAAARLPDRVVLTGRLEHDELVDLLPACEAQVVPSTFPEAFGMVAAEAAACGVLPISAAHSGLAEVSRALAHAVPVEVAPWLSFPLGVGAVDGLAERLVAWLRAPEPIRRQAREGLVRVARERFGWEGVARSVLAAAGGELGLPEVMA